MSVSRSAADCPQQPISAATFFWVAFAVLTLLALTIGAIIW
ncbi:unnamed protein product, partial [Allacma fusca]